MTRYIVFDVETPNRYNNRISAIGITVIEDGKIIGDYSSYVNPETFFDGFNIRLTGIDDQAVLYAPTFPQLWDTISDIMESGILVAHNALFDLNVLKQCLHDYKIDWRPTVEYCCTVQIGRKILPDISHKLNDMCEYYQIGLDHHQADSDSRAAAEILLRYMKSGTEIENFTKKYRL